MRQRFNWATIAMTIAVTGMTIDRASAQELVTDRPDYTESSDVMARGLVQLESGFSYERDGDGNARVGSITLPAALVRIGLGRRMELRLGSDGFQSSADRQTRTSGMSDVEVGAKLRLFNQDQIGVDLAVLPMMSLPTGANDLSSGAVDPTLKLTWARSLSAGFDLTGNFNIASVSDGNGRFAQRAVSVSLGHDLVSGWGGFLEGYAFAPMERHSSSGVTIDGGITRPLGSSLQLDVEIGRGVTRPAPDWFMGFGFAVRRGHAGGRQ